MKNPYQWAEVKTSKIMMPFYLLFHVVIPITSIVLTAKILSSEKFQAKFTPESIAMFWKIFFTFSTLSILCSCFLPLVYIYGLKKVVTKIKKEKA